MRVTLHQMLDWRTMDIGGMRITSKKVIEENAEPGNWRP